MQTVRLLALSSARSFRYASNISRAGIKLCFSTNSTQEPIQEASNSSNQSQKNNRDHLPGQKEYKSLITRVNEEITKDKTEKLFEQNAPLGKRFCSALIDDSVAITIGLTFNMFITPLFGITALPFESVSLYMMAPLFGFADCLSTSSRSLGKKLMHLKVVDSKNRLASKSLTLSRALWYMPLITVPGSNIVVLFTLFTYNCINYYCLFRYKRDITEYLTNVRTVEEGDHYQSEYQEFKEREKSGAEKNSNQSAANVVFLLAFIAFILFKNIKFVNQESLNKNVNEMLQMAEESNKRSMAGNEKNRLHYRKIEK